MVDVFAQYDMKASVPLNPDVRQGRLSNGLTYYICKNAGVAERANFYIVQNVGSLLEDDEQNGLAHFLEHMAFSGTEHFPGNMIAEVLKRHGVEIGSHVNASTSHNETVYQLANIPTPVEGLVDTCLLILHDWSRSISLDDQTIDKERKVVIEEERTTASVSKRLSAKTMPVLLKGSKYVTHNVIGDMSIIKNFKRQTLVDYYRDWYRPDLQAIVVVGDVDVDRLEGKIIDLFSKIPVVADAKPRPFFSVPLRGDLSYVLAVDKEVPYSFVSLNILSEATKPEMKNHGYMKDLLVEGLYGLMFKSRIAKLVQQKNSACLAADSKMGPLVRGYRVYVISATANLNQEAKALELVYAENERLKRHGFTEGELADAKRALLSSFEKMYLNKDKVASEQLVAEIRAYFLENEPAPGFEYYYHFAKSVIPTIGVEEVSAKAKAWITRENMVISVAGPKNVVHLTKGEALSVLKKVEKMDLKPYESEDREVKGTLIPEPLRGGKIVQEGKWSSLEAEEWRLDNGARVVFRKADYEKNEVALVASSKGGTSLYGLDLLPSGMMLSQLMPAYGLGDFSTKELSRLLMGKDVQFGVSVDALSEGVSGSSTPEDFETLMQLVYLCFEKPRFDGAAHELMMQQARASLQSSRMSDSLQLILNNYDPRVLLYHADFLDRVSLEGVEKVYRDRIQDASDFTFFIVGNMDAEQVRPLVEKYIGSMKSTYRKESWKDNGVRCPQGTIRKVIPLEGEVAKATVIEVYSKEMEYGVRDNFYFGVLQSILNLRCTQRLREEAGGTYNVSVQGSSEREPFGVYRLSVHFDCDPVRVEELKDLFFGEVDRMIKNGPTQEELVQVVIGIRNQELQAKAHNAYWMNVLMTYGLYGLDLTDAKNSSDILDYVTPEDVRDFTQRFFTGVNLIDLVFTSEKK